MVSNTRDTALFMDIVIRFPKHKNNNFVNQVVDISKSSGRIFDLASWQVQAGLLSYYQTQLLLT